MLGYRLIGIDYDGEKVESGACFEDVGQDGIGNV